MDKRGEWESFVRAHCGKQMGSVFRSPLFKLIAENFPIEFITKLISTAVNVSSCDVITRICAARLIHHVAHCSRHFLQKVNAGIAVETLELFRRSALDFLLNHSLGTEFQNCGDMLTVKLLHSSLESNTKWDEFLELTKRGFSLSHPQLLYRILHVFCAQPFPLARKFVTLLKPCIRENQSQFVDTLLTLLQAGNDYRPHYVLPSVCGLFSATNWTRLMEGAIMSPYFDNESVNRFAAAHYLRFCIAHTAEFHFSPPMIQKLEDIIQRLYRSPNLNEKREAEELHEARARRIWKVPRNCRYRKRSRQ